MNIQPFLSHLSKYITLDTAEEQILLSKIKYRKYLKNQYVVQQGDVCKHESFVITGSVKTFFVDPKGQEHVIAFGIENWWVADLGSYITQSPADFNVQCLENTELVQLSYDNLSTLYKEIPKIERFFRIVLQNAYVASQKRIVENISLSAKERYLKFRETYPEFEQRVPQYLIASYLGITKEFLSKIRNQLTMDN